ncbi:MAG: hypothetical protein ACR2Q3_01960 [Woeseiaceae bacterium]
MELLPIFAMMVVVLVVLMSSLKIAGESQRFAVFTLGKFQAFKGPGLIFIAPYIQQVSSLKAGDVGVLTSSEFARFDDVDIPVRDAGSLQQGQDIRIDGFDGAEPRFAASSVAAAKTCPNCGHKI